MGKRKSEEDEEYIRSKIRKLEKKLEKRTRTESNESQRPLTPPSPQVDPEPQPGPSNPEVILDTDEEKLSEELLLALGNEGEETTIVGDPITNELALRWTRIMNNGLGKDAREHISKKYPTPSNFLSAVAPSLNPEIKAAVSEVTFKRDKRIIHRQNVLGKVMTCLGKSLTSLLKGNINSKLLIEEINDAAKLTAEVFYQDSASRKFFALAGANQTVKDAVRNSKSDELLFGKDCSEKIKAAQTIQKTKTQIMHASSIIKTKKSIKPGNWKGPPPQQYQVQQQHYNQARGGPRQQPQRKNYRQYKDQKRQPHKSNYRR